MQLPPLTRGRILSRYKRFFADVELENGEVVTAHCPNTGSMTGCWEPGASAQISFSDNPKRKLAWTLERVDMGQGWIGVNTARTNPVIEEWLAGNTLPELSGYKNHRREVKKEMPGERAQSRLDFLLSANPDRPDLFVEVKNVTLWRGGDCLSFPDAVSERAKRHLDGLALALEQGMRGAILFALNRPEGNCFAPARDIDPEYADRLQAVSEKGVEVYAVRLVHTEQAITVGGRVPVRL